jgi:hypothetical protein
VNVFCDKYSQVVRKQPFKFESKHTQAELSNLMTCLLIVRQLQMENFCHLHLVQ